MHHVAWCYLERDGLWACQVVLDNDEGRDIATYHQKVSGYLLLDIEVIGAYDRSGEPDLGEDVNEDDFGAVIKEG
jgi:hypothetical protein